jgi:hypothetical protein
LKIFSDVEWNPKSIVKKQTKILKSKFKNQLKNQIHFKILFVF